MNETEALQQQISDEYFAELMNNTLGDVFEALREKQIALASKRMTSKVNSMAKFMGKKVTIRVKDSSWSGKEGEKSDFAGRRIGFTVIPEYCANRSGSSYAFLALA